MGRGFLNRVSGVLLACTLLLPSAISASAEYEIQVPQVFLDGISYDLTVSSPATAPTADSQPTPLLRVNDFPYAPSRSDGEWIFHGVTVSGTEALLSVEISGEVVQQAEVPVIPAWVSILPPLVAIGMALLIRSVLPALMLGLWLGAWALEGLTAKGVFTGLFASFEVYVANAVADYDHATIMLFTFMIAGMVGVISRNGGMRGIVEWIITGANSAKRGQLAVWSLGLLIFFDDYSNTLVVGNTSRSITDRLRISREKLAYLVDSTAAPLATVALVTTWIGYQVSLIGDAIAPLDDLTMSPYSIFLNSILYSFYPFMAILLVVLVITTGREFGPMLAAERRARPLEAVAIPILTHDWQVDGVDFGFRQTFASEAEAEQAVTKANAEASEAENEEDLMMQNQMTAQMLEEMLAPAVDTSRPPLPLQLEFWLRWKGSGPAPQKRK